MQFVSSKMMSHRPLRERAVTPQQNFSPQKYVVCPAISPAKDGKITTELPLILMHQNVINTMPLPSTRMMLPGILVYILLNKVFIIDNPFKAQNDSKVTPAPLTLPTP